MSCKLQKPLFRMLLPAVLLAAAAGCAKQEDAGRAPPPPTAVVVADVASRSWSDVIEAIGTAQANESIILTAKITETVRKVNFADGQKVDAGDVVVELTSSQQAAQLKDAQAMAKDADRQYQRQQDLVRQGTVSKSLFDTATATRDSNLAKVDNIRAQLSDRVIAAPFAGVLGLRRVSVGTLVTPGTAITSLDDIHVIKLDFAVSETELASLKKGLVIRAKTPAYPDRAFEGQIDSLDSRVDPVTRAITVRALIPNPDALLRPGMLLNVEVLSRDRMALSVPELALVPVGQKQYVYKVSGDDVARQIEVKVGTRRAGEVEVVEGLVAGDRVIVEGTVNVRDGAKVAVKENTSASAAQTAKN